MREPTPEEEAAENAEWDAKLRRFFDIPPDQPACIPVGEWGVRPDLSKLKRDPDPSE
jgi:hypothetical protein